MIKNKKEGNKMRKKLTRNITVTYVKVSEINIVDGKPEVTEQTEIKLLGKYDREKALRKVKSQMKKDNLYITDLKLMNEEYTIDVEKFIANAELVKSEEI